MGVHFPSTHEGWTVGWDAANDIPVLLHYSGGVWIPAASPSTGPEGGFLLSGVHFTSETEGWAVGEGGNVAASGHGVLTSPLRRNVAARGRSRSRGRLDHLEGSLSILEQWMGSGIRP